MIGEVSRVAPRHDAALLGLLADRAEHLATVAAAGQVKRVRLTRLGLAVTHKKRVHVLGTRLLLVHGRHRPPTRGTLRDCSELVERHAGGALGESPRGKGGQGRVAASVALSRARRGVSARGEGLVRSSRERKARRRPASPAVAPRADSLARSSRGIFLRLVAVVECQIDSKGSGALDRRESVKFHRNLDDFIGSGARWNAVSRCTRKQSAFFYRDAHEEKSPRRAMHPREGLVVYLRKSVVSSVPDSAPPHTERARVDSHEVVTPRVRPPHFAAARTSVDTRSRRPASVVSGAEESGWFSLTFRIGGTRGTTSPFANPPRGPRRASQHRAPLTPLFATASERHPPHDPACSRLVACARGLTSARP